MFNLLHFAILFGRRGTRHETGAASPHVTQDNDHCSGRTFHGGEDKEEQPLSTTGLAEDYTLGVRQHSCCRAPILNPRPDLKSLQKPAEGN